MSNKDWMKDATASTDDELAAMDPYLPDTVRQGIRADTASSQPEVDALMRRLRQTEVSASPTLAWLRPVLVGGGLMVAGVAAAAAVGVVVAPQILAPDTFTDAPTPTALRLDVGSVHQVDADVAVTGLGELSIDQVSPSGSDVSLVQGLARFDVSTEANRRLVVTASDVELRVTGESLFSVQHLGEEVEVDVDSGEVAVAWGEVSLTLQAGQSWTRGGEVAASIPVDVDDAAGVAGEGVADTVEAAELTPQDTRGTSEGVPTPEARPAMVTPPTPSPAPAGEDDGEADLADTKGASVESDPCADDPWSLACRAQRRPAGATSPESRYQAMVGAMGKVDRAYSAATEVVEDANDFLEKFAEHERADEVRYFRVKAAFYGSRASTTIAYADAFLAGTSTDATHRAEVEQMRRVATLRRDVMNDAQRDCDGADPLLAELVRLETGTKRNEALARRGLCAEVRGDPEAAKVHLSKVQVDRLPVGMAAEVREAWTRLVPAPREREER